MVSFAKKTNACHTVLMSKKRLVAVAEIKPPQLNILIRRPKTVGFHHSTQEQSIIKLYIIGDIISLLSSNVMVNEEKNHNLGKLVVVR